jgi:cytokinin dehydrogenase
VFLLGDGSGFDGTLSAGLENKFDQVTVEVRKSMQNIQRRTLVAGLGALVVGAFDPVQRTWIPEANAASFPGRLPRLDGRVVTDAAALAAVSTDAGNIVHATPFAILEPGSVDDIAKMVRFCRRHGIKVAARGQGHTTFGQSLVEGGLSVDMSKLSEIHSICATSADVGAGLRWRELVAATIPLGFTPPVLTGYIGLSIGGTLSVGGISACNTQGAQVDHVRELEVVTGEGDIVICSEHRHRDLFEAVLAGLGQCGIITRAVVDLVPAKSTARVYLLNYVDNDVFFKDLRTLLQRGEFDDIFTLWQPDGAGGWIYGLNAVRFFDPASPPDDAQLLRGLSYDPATLDIEDVPYHAYVLRVDGAIDFFRSIGLWDGVQHPWFDVFLPGSAVEDYVGEVVPALTPEDVGPTGFLLLFPQKRSKFRRPFLRVPDEEWVFLFDILTAAPAPGQNPEFSQRMLARNRTLFERAAAVGGKRYPIGSVTFTRWDWIAHYGRAFPRFSNLKRRYDPERILTPGPGIF